MKHLYRLLFLTLLLELGCVVQLQGSHAMGVDMTYKCLGNNQYEITLQFYRDCGGIGAPNFFPVTAVSGCTGQSIPATLNAVPGSFEVEKTPICVLYTECTECNDNPPPNCPNPPYPGVELYTYRGVITLPSECASWRVNWVTCCRNAAITNLQNPGSEDMYIDVLINNENGLCNNSPKFSELPTPYICNNQLYNYNHGVVEPDGDSVVYELINPMTTGGATIPYSGGLTPNNPLSTSTGMTFDKSSGQMTMVPNQIQQAVITVRISEYRNGVLVGQCIRDIQIVIINTCTSNQEPPVLSNYLNPGGGGYIIDSITMGVCPGTPITFDIVGTDGNGGDSVYVSSNFDSVFTGASYTVINSSNPSKASFTWTPSSADIGLHYFVVSAQDNHCPTISSTSRGYAIRVQNEVKAGPDKKVCDAGGPVELTAAGGSEFHWRPTNSIIAAAPDSSWVHVLPSQTVTYTVTSNCNNSDTVTVERVPSYIYTLTPDDTICRFDSIHLDITADPGAGPFNIQWSPDFSLDTNGVFNVISQPFNTITYTIELVSEVGCRVVDSVKVVVDGEKPRITLTPDKNYLCKDPSDQVQMDILSIPAQCGPTLQGCSGSNKITVQVGGGTDISSTVTPFYGSYKNFRMQMLYTKEDLKSLGVEGGTISELSFNIGQKLTSSTFPNFYVRIGCTELQKMPLEFQSGLTTVFGPTNFTTTNGWVSIPLSTEYDWDGFSNLIIEVCFTGNGNFNNDWIEYTKTSYTSVIYRFDDFVGPGCDLSPSLSSDTRPNLQLKICSQPLTNVSFSWSPTQGVSNPTISNPVISGLSETTEFTLTADYNGCIGTDDHTIFVDSTRVLAGPDTLLCDTTELQLFANAIGSPPPIELSCGDNGTPVVNPVIDHSLGNGSQSFSGTMFKNGHTDMKFQMLLRAPDLISEGIRSGIITNISFEVAAKNSNMPAENFQISMGCTELDELNGTAFEPTTVVVYSDPAYNNVAGMNTFTLSTPFDWDGQSNIIIQICWDNDQTFIGGTDNIKVYDVNYDAMIRTYGNDSIGCDLVTPKTPYQKLPNMILGVAAPPPGQFAYQWMQLSNGTNTLSNDTINNPIATPNEGQTVYQVQIETEFGCVTYDTVVVDKSILDVTVAKDTAICEGNAANLFATGGDTYEWTLPDGLNTPDSSFTLASPDLTTTYTVTIYDSAGCVVTREVEVVVNDTPSVDAGPYQSILVGEVVDMSATGGIQYDWEPPSGLSDPTIPNPQANPTQTITYTVTVTDANGCSNSDTVTIDVSSVDDVFIPTAFSPNGDGVNDVWYVVPLGLAELERLEIYNRWGNMVFSSDSFSDGWDGTAEGESQQVGTYVYLLVGYNYYGERIIKRGNITLLR